MESRSSIALLQDTRHGREGELQFLKVQDLASLRPGHCLNVGLVYFFINLLLNQLETPSTILVLDSELCQALASGAQITLPNKFYAWGMKHLIILVYNQMNWRLLMLDHPIVSVNTNEPGVRHYEFREVVKGVVIDPRRLDGARQFGHNIATRL